MSSQPLVDEHLPAFFLRNGLDREDLDSCLGVPRKRGTVEVVAQQGGCSFTVIWKTHEGDRMIVQFRLPEHALSNEISFRARMVYGELVPMPLWFEEIVLRGGLALQVFGMTVIDGTTFRDLQPQQTRLAAGDTRRLGKLMSDLANFFALGWQAAVRTRLGISRRVGKVGSSVRHRLLQMERDLPTPWLRERSLRLRQALDSGVLDSLPVVLNHGDFLPSNILVDEKDWTLKGLVDWAEGEYLPFGMTLYGIEHLLGHVSGGKFVYYNQATTLRQVFWKRLRELLPDLHDARLWRAMLVSRDIGVFLWHGIAWDDGKLNRVVNSVDDGLEVAYLEAFLSVGQDDSRVARAQYRL